MITYVPRNDLSAFVEGLAQASSPAGAIDELLREIHEIESNISRDARTKFEQVRYLNSLHRVKALLRTSVVPADLTPSERLAIRGLSRRITDNVSRELVYAFGQVTLPAGMFGEDFEVRHRLAG